MPAYISPITFDVKSISSDIQALSSGAVLDMPQRRLDYGPARSGCGAGKRDDHAFVRPQLDPGTCATFFPVEMGREQDLPTGAVRHRHRALLLPEVQRDEHSL